MQFFPTDEQAQLRDMVRRYVQRDYPALPRGPKRAGQGCDAAQWTAFAELGLFGAGLSEEHGGFGGGAFDQALIAEELGRGLVVEPYVDVAVIAAEVLVQAGDAGADLLAGIVAGEARPVLAVPADGATVLTAESDTALSGDMRHVYAAPSATVLLVPVKTPEGTVILTVDADAPGLTRQDFRALDGRWASHLTFANVAASAPLLQGVDADAALAAALARGRIAACAEVVGTMDAALQLTCDYLNTRQQFGVALATFQALQHRLADMFVAIEQARSITQLAISCVDNPAELEPVSRAAKALTGRAARLVGAQVVQMHGGMGVTEECMAGHYFKRLLQFDLNGGSWQSQVSQLSDRRGKAWPPASFGIAAPL